MIIPIDKEIRIRGTEHCWQLEKRRQRNGKDEWQAYKYFQNVRDAVGAAWRREIRLHPSTGLSDAIEAVDTITQRYSKLLDKALDEHESKGAA